MSPVPFQPTSLPEPETGGCVCPVLLPQRPLGPSISVLLPVVSVVSSEAPDLESSLYFILNVGPEFPLLIWRGWPP